MAEGKGFGNLKLERGVSGLSQQGGRISEEWLRKLSDDRANKIWREMSDNDETVGAVLFAIEMLLRSVTCRVDAYGPEPEYQDQAEFVRSLMDDMSHTWADFISEVISFLPFGWSSVELCYKRREGPHQKDATRRSKHSDGLIGWRKLPLRAQDTLDHWEFDEDGGIKGWWQSDPNGGPLIFLPIEKTLLFRTTSRKNNPEGRSILRTAYQSWYRKKHVQDMESIGVERDLAGLPIFWLPPEMLDDSADSNTQAQAAQFRKIVENLRNDEQMGMCLPWYKDENGNELIKFELAGTGSRRLFDTTAIIERYDRRIAMTVLADFIMLGHERVGSLALSSDKTSLFATTLGAWLTSISDVLNRHSLPRLYELNGWDPSTSARFVFEDIEKQDALPLAQAFSALAMSGGVTPGGEADESHWRNLLGMPEVGA